MEWAFNFVALHNMSIRLRVTIMHSSNEASQAHSDELALFSTFFCHHRRDLQYLSLPFIAPHLGHYAVK